MGFFLTLAIFAAVFVLSELLRPKPDVEEQRPSELGDFQFPTAQQDRPVPLVWGTVRQKGPNVIWYGDLVQEAITETTKTGLFSSETLVTGYKYKVGIQFAICRGGDATPVELRRIWIGDDEVWSGSIPGEGSASIDEPELLGGNQFGQGGVVATVSWRPGTRTQTVNGYLDGTTELQIGGQTLRFTGTAYAVCEQGYVGNSEQIRPWAFEVRRIPNGLGLATPSVNGGDDANPMNVIYEAMTDTEWGRSFPAADIDAADFAAAAATLLSEGNGFSMLDDRDMDVVAFLDEIQRQVDGVLYMDHRTGKWKIKLARAEAGPFPQLTNPIRVESYTGGSWEKTTNHLSITFSDRAQDYAVQPAVAQDPANAQLQGGGSVTTGKSFSGRMPFPGVKDSTLANQIADRELRTRSIPLIQAKVIVDRQFWDILPGSVIEWTDAPRQLTARQFRVKRIDYGSLEREEIALDLVEDVFQFTAGSYGNPPASKWTPPSQVPLAFPSTRQIAFEAPRALVSRAPEAQGVVQSLLWAAARVIAAAVSFTINERHPSGGGSYTQVGEAFRFMLIGELKNALTTGTALPTTGILLTATPDTQTAIEAAFTDSSDTADVGANLVNLLLVDGEFILTMGATTSGGDVQLTSAYRGVLDTAQAAHSAGADVYLCFVGGGVSGTAIPETASVDVTLLGRSRYGLSVTAATAITFTMDKRVRRPYCPGRLSLDDVVYKSSASLEGAGSGAEAVGLDLDFIRRDYRTADEIQALATDAATLFADFPSANTTTVEVEVVDDPDGTPTTLFTDAGISAALHVPKRIDILKATDGALPTRMRLDLRERHLDASESLLSRNFLRHDFDVTSALTGQVEFGALDTAEESAIYTADAAGQHDFTLSSAFSSGDVQYDIDTGGGFPGTWGQLIAGGATTGNIAGVAVSDQIKVRHQSTEVGPKQLDMAAPGAGTDAFAILYS